MSGAESSPCPHDAREPVRFTWWGGHLGPRLFAMERCIHCGRTMSSRTGRTPWLGIALYLATALGVAIGLVALALTWLT